MHGLVILDKDDKVLRPAISGMTAEVLRKQTI